MGPWILTAVCLAGVSAAGWMAWTWRDLERAPRDDLVPGWAGARRALRSLAVTVSSGFIAGALVGGLGGRLMMRILAATSPDAAQGAITQADEVVGEISFAGSMAVVVFAGILGGMLAALIHRALRHWLPARGWLAGLVSVAIVLGLLGTASDLLNPGNRDFTILSPLWLAVLLIGALVGLFGIVQGVLYERLNRAVPELGGTIGAVAYLPLALVSVAGMPAVAILVIVGLAAVSAMTLNQWIKSDGLLRAGRVVVGIGTVGAVGVSVARAAEILSA